MTRLRGKVKWWDDVRGIGFLTGADGRDYFVHHSEIAVSGERRSLLAGEPVELEPQESDKGPRARAVVPLGRATPGLAPPGAVPAADEAWPPPEDPPDTAEWEPQDREP